MLGTWLDVVIKYKDIYRDYCYQHISRDLRNIVRLQRPGTLETGLTIKSEAAGLTPPLQ